MKRDQSRLIIIFIAFALVFGAVALKLFYWQIIKADSLRLAGRYQSTLSLVTSAKRGDILFSDKFPIATNKISYLLYANPKKVDSVDTYANLLSPILQADPASLSARLNLDLFWVSLQSRLTYEQKLKLEELKLQALGFEIQTEREYPEASMAAHLVGVVGKNKDGQDQG